jgi:hypothetical protein
MADALVSADTTVYALWALFGISAFSAIFFSIWGTLRITAWNLGIPIKDRPAQHLLNTGLLVSFLNMVAAAGVIARHFIWLRPDTLDIYVSYLPWICWTICFAVMSRASALYLAHNYEHRDMVFYTAGLSCLALIPASFFNTYQYLWLVVHAIGFIYTIHLLWVYRTRPGSMAVGLMLMMILWPLCFTLPFSLGHAFGRYISFAAETWWTFAGVVLGQLGFMFYMNLTLDVYGKTTSAFITRHFKSREECVGYPGWETYASTWIPGGVSDTEIAKVF